MEPSVIIFPIDQEIKFKQSDLEALKNSENGYKNSQYFQACTISNVQYYISIYPNGHNDKFRGNVCLFFYIKNGNAINVDSDITFQIESANYKYTLENGRGAVLCQTSKFFNSSFFGSIFSGLYYFRSNYFVDGVMTVKMKGMLKITLPAKITHPFSAQWKIKEADLEALRTSKTNGSLQTKCFNISPNSNIKYYLKIYPNGSDNEYRGQTWIFLVLYLGNASKIDAVYNISIPSNNFSMNLKDEYDKSKGWGARISSTDDLFNPDNRYFVDGEMILKVTGTLLIDKDSNESTNLANDSEPEKDFTIVVGDKNFKVHKKVLIEASPVFEAMFNSGMKEVTEKKMTIPEFTPDIVETAIKLLYSDSIPSNFTFEQILLLLQFADKYVIKLIMDLVQDFLIPKISPNNVCYLINFTSTTTVSATKLHSKCVEYLLKCSKESQPVHNLHILEKDFVVKIRDRQLKKKFLKTTIFLLEYSTFGPE